ncbi:phytanoyl-CoA dioxygenase family protein [Chitinophagaceae bacterium LWZ2-11]
MQLAASNEKNRLGVYHLNRFYSKTIAIRNGKLSSRDVPDEWNLDATLLSALNIGIEQTIRYLYNEAPPFSIFEDWILEANNNKPDESKIKLFNDSITGQAAFNLPEENASLPLTEEDLRCWQENGYVIVRNAISKEDCEATINAIADFLSLDINNPDTWYEPHPAKQGIMVQFFQHKALEKNRDAAKIRGAFEQIWQRKDLWVVTDRVSFNPPENEKWQFPGPRLHWDVSLDLPIPFSTQGLLYLSDTQHNQGAFTLVPGFHNKIDNWIHSLPEDANPRMQDLHALGSKPIAANAGDFIIWHQALPHGSSPNTATLPRIVQYINYVPIDVEEKKDWK